MIFNILEYSLSSVLWGIIISLACVGLYVLIVKGWYKDAIFSFATWFNLLILFFLLSFQCTMIVGSIKIQKEIDNLETAVKDIVDTNCYSSEIVSDEESKDILYQVIENYPLLKYYVGDGEFVGFTAAQLPHVIASELQFFMKWYIFRRLLWCLFFVFVAALFTIRSLRNEHPKLTRPTTVHQRRRKNLRH